MRIAFICPFDIHQLTGTPIRASAVIKAASLGEPLVISDQENIGAFRFTLRALSQLSKYKPDIIHAFTTLSVVPAFLYKIFFLSKVKIVFEMHGWSWFETRGNTNLLKRIVFLSLDRFGFAFAHRVIAMSHSQKRFLEKISKRKKIEVMWGPASSEIIYMKPIERAEFIAGYLGNMSFWQGLPIVLDAAKILLNDKHIRFELAGFKPAGQNLPELSNVKYLGKIPALEVAATLKCFDVLLSPRLESEVSNLQYPQKLSEYIAAGRPIIATDISDQRKVIEEGGCGIVIKDMDGQKLADALRRISSLSYEERERMGKRAVSFAKEHVSFEVFSKNLLKIYQDLGF
ncbi:MAG TPA: glycosyltransferase family 4 protein [Candidatus Paceibacterota bacterium]|nr:glycosyltransferase family 4 protein [Candidatus Paceibacterota bacterium]